ncbi:acyl-CoA dehydrogenase [Ferrimonas gelatinilytica]|uniref:Acyl-coenzyme A dehydrogenase n=1 Tax=Ferrimonas gelatinilytica TaxID=1255257 RepID=A0ABP9RY35_9GAMM
MTLLFLLAIAVIVIFAVKDIRRQVIAKPAYDFMKRVLPPLSQTEREAMEAGNVWWDGELFRGAPDWNQLHSFPANSLTADEQAFLDNQVKTLLTMIDDYEIVNQKDMPKAVWDYLRKEKFFALIIPKSYGGLEFSAYANSTIVSRIAARSMSVAVSVMVPNSLGPGELLAHYGTEAQKDRWLPALANGDEIPCFALTGPTAGSDAGGIPDVGIVCRGEFEGEEVLGVRVTWDKRYITLAPVATVLGLAFKLKDPDALLGNQKEIGITCALIPTDHPGVENGNRHDPLSQAFMNGTTRGKDVFIPMEWLIGGAEYAGKGWRMLVECLSAGRGISLPALATATGHLSTRSTSAYCGVRSQFGVNIGEFEGVQEALARIAGNTYILESARKLTLTAIDTHQKPSVVTAIAKYHMTELGRRVINDAMDVQAGKGIQLGPNNYLGNVYTIMPVAITVEGANILTRNLMIFGQGATRCHPYVLAEMEAVADPDTDKGLARFDGLLMSHIVFSIRNALTSLWHGLTGARFADKPVAGPTAHYYQQLSRLSANLAIVSDLAMLTLGGDLKRREMISARLGDVLSQLYLGSAVLRNYEMDGRQQADLPFVEYAMAQCLHEAAKALSQALRNFPNRFVSVLCRLLVQPLGNHFHGPSDEQAKAVARAVQQPGSARDRLTHLCQILDEDEGGVALVEKAFLAQYGVAGIAKRLKKAQRAGQLPRGPMGEETLDLAVEQALVTEQEKAQWLEAQALSRKAIDVDEFTKL